MRCFASPQRAFHRAVKHLKQQRCRYFIDDIAGKGIQHMATRCVRPYFSLDKQAMHQGFAVFAVREYGNIVAHDFATERKADVMPI